MTEAEKMKATGVGNTIGTIGGVVGETADALGPADIYGKKSAASNILGGVGKGAAMGASIGSIIPGIGTLIGGAVGAVGGAVSGIINNDKQKKIATSLKFEEKMQNSRIQDANLTARIEADPTLLKGSLASSYYAAGGRMSNNISSPNARSLSSTAVEFTGPSHEKGGIKLDNLRAEVEGKESANAGYVFSDRLGFAAPHKKLARAIGKIEDKALNPHRINSIKILKAEENNLKLSQEYVKNMLGLNS
jgi:hypothetical protein